MAQINISRAAKVKLKQHAHKNKIRTLKGALDDILGLNKAKPETPKPKLVEKVKEVFTSDSDEASEA